MSDPGDIYSITVDQLLGLEGYQRKSAENLVEGIRGSRERGLARVLNALGVRHVGETAAQIIAQSFGSIDRISLRVRGEAR